MVDTSSDDQKVGEEWYIYRKKNEVKSVEIVKKQEI